jgi:DNA-binding protein HU-beta
VAVNRSDLVDAVAKVAGIGKRQADAAVSALVGAVIGEAKAGNKTSVFGFGTFTPTSRPARMGRNPRTGAPVKIAASKSVRFAPASAFKSALNSKGAARKAVPAKKAAPAKRGPARKAVARKGRSAKR